MEINLTEIFDISSLEGNKSSKAILQAIKTNYQSNFDYIKFKQAVNQLKLLGQDEMMAVQSASTTARSLGIDKDILLKSVNHYLNVIKKEKDKFAEAYAGQYEDKVKAKEVELENTHKQISDRELKISKLKEEIEILKLKTDKLQAKKKENEDKIILAKQNFLEAYNHIEGVISKDLSIINQVL